MKGLCGVRTPATVACMNTTTCLITINGVLGARDETVRPIRTNADGSKTLVSLIKGSRVATQWIATNRIRRAA